MYLSIQLLAYLQKPGSFLPKSAQRGYDFSMASSDPPQQKSLKSKAPLSLGQSILLAIILAFAGVALFGVIVFLFIRGAQQLNLSGTAYIVIFVFISGIFAWLLKRLTDIAAGMSRLWFPEDSDEEI